MWKCNSQMPGLSGLLSATTSRRRSWNRSVTRSALQHAASIGALVLTTETLIADKPEPKKESGGGGGGGGMSGYDMM